MFLILWMTVERIADDRALQRSVAFNMHLLRTGAAKYFQQRRAIFSRWMESRSYEFRAQSDEQGWASAGRGAAVLWPLAISAVRSSPVNYLSWGENVRDVPDSQRFGRIGSVYREQPLHDSPL
jgi:hypothetical protein